LFLKILHHF